MRSRDLGLCLLTALVAGCGPGGPSGLEGFGSFGETGDGDPGDGDPGDGDPGDGDPGDGDGDPLDCIDAIAPSSSEFYISDFIDESRPNDHEFLCVPTPSPDYSTSWRATISGEYRAELVSEGPSWLTILRGGCDGEIENCNGESWPTIVDFYAQAGQDYTFVVDGYDWVGFFELYVYPLGSSGVCPDGGELFDVPQSAFGSTFGADNQFSSPCGGEAAPDRTYIFYPPVSGTYRINTLGSDYDTVVYAFEGYCGGGLLDCNDDNNDLTSEIVVDMFAGGVYTIVVDGWGDSAGNYDLNIELAGSSSLCDDLIELGDALPAVIEWPPDFTSFDVHQGCSFAPLEQRLSWIAPADGLYQASLDTGPAYSGLSVFPEGCNGGPFLCEVSGNQGPSIIFDATAGQEIVLVTEWDFDAPFVNLTIDAVGGGQGCGQAMPAGVPSVASGTTVGSGNQYTGSCSTAATQEVERWWMAPATGTYLLSTQGSSYDTLVFVRSGGCDGPEIACNDDSDFGLWSEIQLDLVAGEVISIFVEGYSGAGDYQLEITSL